jgi:hypothetical protein
MQRILTLQLAAQSGLETISFQHYDCLVFNRGDCLKLFKPFSKRALGGTPQERLVIGDLLVIFEQDLERLRPPSKRFKFTSFVTSAPISNFTSIVEYSRIENNRLDDYFFIRVKSLLDALPNNRAEWLKEFGDDFFNVSKIDRCIKTVDYLRHRKREK